MPLLTERQYKASPSSRFFKSSGDSVTLQEIPVSHRTQGAHAILLIETENKLLQQAYADSIGICMQAFFLSSGCGNNSIFCLTQGQVIFIGLTSRALCSSALLPNALTSMSATSNSLSLAFNLQTVHSQLKYYLYIIGR